MRNTLFHKLINPLDLDKEQLRLIFKDKQFNQEFHKEYSSKTGAFMILYLTIGILIYGGFGMIGTQVENELLLRFGIVLPIWILITIGIARHTIKKGQYLILSGFTLLLIISYIFLMMSAANNYTNYLYYFTGLIIIILSFNALLRLKLLQMFTINILVILSYWLLDFYFAGIQFKHPFEFLLNILEVISACLIGWIACYNYEYLYRNDFYKQKCISRQAHELQLSYELMEKRVKERTYELELEKQKSYRFILKGQQAERQRIAQDLHDSINIQLINLKRKVEAPEIHDIGLQQDIDKIISFVREVSHNMLPYTLIHFGLLNAIEELCQNMKRHHKFEVEYSKIGMSEEKRWDTVIETEIFRIIQELFANIIKHANASKISVDIIDDGQILYLTIEDNGIGFDTKKENTPCFGLNNIIARVKLLNGSINFDSIPQKGTTIMINIPV